MAILKCKMCGADLEITGDMNLAECEYCGTKQTVPTADSEKKISLFTRANKLRAACDFDKAAGVYESIVTEFPEEAEAYWGLILCRYGIEYVDDPATGKKIPTCHRSSFDSLMDSDDFELVMENADSAARRVYREEAKFIEELRKSIIEVSSKEEPYDIFICYKETDENGDRTIDSVIAQDVYTELTNKGYRVFFSRITLEDKLGQEYEPYIFAALNSAKIMLAFGTDYDYFNAVWVKNEWSRFLQLIAKGEKKSLIPCYKNIDAYDMPKEFAKLQAQDMGKVGAVQDLLRGVEKILGGEQPEKPAETVIVSQSGGPNVDALLKRGNMALEDSEWDKAKKYFDQVLNMDAECAVAYLGLAMADVEVCEIDCFAYAEELDNKYYLKAKKFADKKLLKELEAYEKEAEEYFEEEARKAAEEKAIKEKNLQDNNKRLEFIREKRRPATNMVSCQRDIVALNSDGTVVETSTWKYASLWSNIIAVSNSTGHLVGLKADGTVVACGSDSCGQCAVSEWTGIVAIATGYEHTIGLKSDGTVVATKFIGTEDYHRDYRQSAVSEWKDIVAIGAGEHYSVGLKSDGTVVVAGLLWGGENYLYWKDIVSVAAGENNIMGVKVDGTVVQNQLSKWELRDCEKWQDIVFASYGAYHVVGLKADGTVVAAGDNKTGQCEVSDWKNILAVFAGGRCTVGLKADGTIVYAGDSDEDASVISEWKLFDDFGNLEEEQKARMPEAHLAKEKLVIEDKRKREEYQKSMYRREKRCQHCGGTFNGLFTKKCSDCGKEKDY